MKASSRLLITLALVFPVAGGCKKKPAESTGDGSGSALTGSGSDTGAGSNTGAGSAIAGAGSDTGAGSAMAGSDSAGGGDTRMSRKGGNCPTLVATSTTKVTIDDKNGTATVAISAADKNAVVTIQERTKAWKDRKPDSASGMHDSKGGKGGDEGMCAVAAPRLAVAEVKNTKDGASITLTLDAEGTKLAAPEQKLALAEVQARADKGAAWMADNLQLEPGGQGGTGPGSGAHGRDHSGKGDAKGMEGKGSGGGEGIGGGKQDGTGGGGGKGSGGKATGP
jgi:hypothetical protein